MNLPILSSALPLIVAGVTAQTSDHAAPTRPTQDLVAIATAAGSLQTLLTAAKAAGMVDALRGKGPLTVFAPSDAAFDKLSKDTLTSLLKPENKAKLAAILSFHVVVGEVPASVVVASKSLTSLQGEPLLIDSKDGVKIGTAKVTKTDVWASNGVIHIIDSVMLPPERKDIVATAIAAGSFKTLVKALTAGGLAEALQGEGPFTVFAPTDAAFGKLDSATLADLLRPENKAKLVSILKYHVVAGRVLARDVVGIEGATTLEGSAAPIVVSKNGAVCVGGANVVSTDVLASNGVIHVIDAVMLPPAGAKPAGAGK